MSEKYDERELEQIMRAGLAERATGAPDRLTEPFVGRHRHRRAWLGAIAAAAVVVGGVGVGLAVGQSDDGRGPDRSPTSAGDPAAVPEDWRAESYGGIQVWVPPTWGTGAAPFEETWDGAGELLDCRDGVPSGPYVGRPVMESDACAVFDSDRQPTPSADFAWIGSVVEPGTIDLGGGYVEETVAVGGVNVTVASTDADLRAHILGSAEAVAVDANGCRTGISTPLRPEGPAEIEATSLSVCLYETDLDGNTVLVWSDRRGAADATAYTEATYETSQLYDAGPCERRSPEGQWLEIGANGPDATRWDVVTFDCMWGETPDSQYPLNKQTVDPWASPAVKMYVVGPSDLHAGLNGYFRGILG